jgi:hypothetical protein
VARAHGGQIVFSSVAGAGSEFALVLPVRGPVPGAACRERDRGGDPHDAGEHRARQPAAAHGGSSPTGC